MHGDTLRRSIRKCCVGLSVGALALSLVLASCGPQGTDEEPADIDTLELALEPADRADEAGEAGGGAEPRKSNDRLDRLEQLLLALRPVLGPLFDLYGVPADPIVGGQMDEGLRALLRDVRIQLRKGVVFVTNRQTGKVIFMGRLDELSAGNFFPENMPAGPGTTPPPACSFTYSEWGACQADGTQTRTVVSSSPAGCAGTPVLSQSCTPAPSACTYAYSPWGACRSDGTQTRTVVSSAPEGCTGTPVLSQSCTYTPPACTYTYSAWGACQANGTQTRTVTATSPAGCTGTPVLSQSCTYTPPACSYTYSAWGACQSNGTQTRTVTATSPAGCTGTPVLSQTCTYVPPTPTCGSCHAIPPATGEHAKHVNSFRLSCGTCHGSGYSATTTNATLHQNGASDVSSTAGFNGTSCSNGCHGSKAW